ncbi:MAG: rhodanese-like domain-containing protein [Pseudomonadota bacterium]
MTIPSLTVDDLTRLIASGVRQTLVDVRKTPAFKDAPVLIPGAVKRDHADVAGWAATLPADVPIIVNCVHGHEVSQNVASALRACGFDARFLEGGIDAWIRAGGRTVDVQ